MNPPGRDLLDDHTISREYAVFERYHREVDMLDTAAVLEELGIPVRQGTQPAGEAWEKFYMGTRLRAEYWLEIPTKDFERARFLLRERAEEMITPEDLREHPFADYTTEELKEVLVDEVKWDIYATVVARKLLLTRDVNVDLSALRQQSRRQVAEEYAPGKGNLIYIVLLAALGIASAILLAFFGLLFALGMLYHYGFGTQIRPDGAKVPLFTGSNRPLARGAFYGVLAAAAVSLLYAIAGGLLPVEVRAWLWWWR